MATLKELQQEVSRTRGAAESAKIAVLGLKERLAIYQQELAVREEVLRNLSPTDARYASATTAVSNARATVNDIYANIAVAEQQQKIAEAYADAAVQLLNDPSTRVDPEPAAVERPALTQEQRNRLDQINDQRIENDQAPLVINTPAEFQALEQSMSQSQVDRSTLDTASTQTAGDAVNNDTRPVGPEPGPSNAEKQPQTHTQNIDGGSIKYIVNTTGSQTILIYDDTGKYMGAGTDIGQAIQVAANSGASPGLLASAAEEYRSSGEDTIRDLSSDAVSDEDEDEDVDSQTGRVSYSDGDEQLSEEENRRLGLNPNGIGEPYMLPVTPLTEAKPKNSTTNDSGKITATPKVQVGSGTGIQYKETPNPLHEYANYTYNLSLHVLTDSEYNSLINNPGGGFKPKVTLIGGANRYSEPQPKGTRDLAFTDDFFFNDLKILTVVGLNHQTRGGNSVEISFTLIEPYGMTLLNRMLDLSVRMRKPNYLDIPYLLEITFFGADDSGQYAKLSNHTKYIPMRLTTAKIRASTKGSEYQITAIPYPKVASLQSLSATKANFEITSRTVGEYFLNGAKDYDTTNKATQDTVRNQRARAEENTRRTDAAKAAGQTGGPQLLSTTAVPIVTSSSFADAYNLWQKQEAAHGYMDEPDEVVFEIHKDIASAKIIDPKTINPKQAEMATRAPNSSSTASSGGKATDPKSAGADFTKSFFNINAGTAITTVLNNMIINSTYITNQLENSETKVKDAKTVSNPDSLSKAIGNKNVQWFKITTKVELKKYDSRRGHNAKKITYMVNPYTHFNASSPDAPKSQPRSAVKRYEYIYTGKNSDIIDFTLDFNKLFSTLAVTDRSKQLAFNTNPGAGSTNNVNGKAEILQNYSITPTQVILNSGLQSTLTGGSNETSSTQQAATLAENIYTGSAGDMLQLNLRIVGDPQFIKQDEILFSQSSLKNNKGQFVDREGGSLAMDTSEIFCWVEFKTPVDIDEQTGLVRKDSIWKSVYFSGFYKILKVTNEFRQGKFIQELMLVRHRNQEGDSKARVSGSDPKSADARKNPNPKDKTNNSKVAGKPNTTGSIFISDDENGEVEITSDNRAFATRGGKVTDITGEKQTPDRPGPVAAPPAPLGEDEPQSSVVITPTASGGTTVVSGTTGGAASSVYRTTAVTPGSLKDKKRVARNAAERPIETTTPPTDINSQN